MHGCEGKRGHPLSNDYNIFKMPFVLYAPPRTDFIDAGYVGVILGEAERH
jgi:hypothetical protein